MKTNETRRKWVKPVLRRIDAGSAETGPTGSPDGGPGGNNKS
jgi:hypothetical protein